MIAALFVLAFVIGSAYALGWFLHRDRMNWRGMRRPWWHLDDCLTAGLVLIVSVVVLLAIIGALQVEFPYRWHA